MNIKKRSVRQCRENIPSWQHVQGSCGRKEPGMDAAVGLELGMGERAEEVGEREELEEQPGEEMTFFQKS